MRSALALMVLFIALCGPAGAQDKPTVAATVDQTQVKTLRDEILTLIAANDRRYTDALAAQKEATTAAFAALRDATAQSLAAQKEAVTKAEEASGKRFDSVNEFRSTLSDQAKTFITAAEAKTRFDAMEKQIGELKDAAQKQAARSGGISEGYVAAVAVVVFVVTVVGAVMFFKRAPQSGKEKP